MFAERKAWSVVGVLCCAVLLASASAVGAASKSDALAAKAAVLMREGKVADAVALLERAVREDTGRRDLRLVMLRAKKVAGKLTTAEAKQLVLAEQEASARIEAQLALIRMGLLQTQSAQVEGNHALALRRLDAVRKAIRRVGSGVDVSVYVKKANDLGAISKHKVPAALSEDAPTVEAPATPRLKMSEEDLKLALRRVREGNVLTDSPAFDPTVTADQLRARALANQKGDKYHVSSEIIDSRLIYKEDEQRFHYERDLHELVQQEVLEALMRTKADMIIPRGDMTIPKGWARRVAGRKNDELWELVGDKKKAEIQRLGSRSSVEFTNTPLGEVVKQLAGKYNVNIVVDAAALRAAGIDPAKVVIDLHLKSATLRSILTWATRPAGLGWSLEDNVYVITLPSKAKQARYTVAYNIMDIALPARQWRPITAREDWQASLDRRALRERSQIYRGDARDLAAGLPLLRYFGGPKIYRYGPDPGEAARLVGIVNAILSR